MKSIGARLARAVNRVGRRSGPVLDGRYHHRSLRSPREVRRALAYVFLNARRHLAKSQGVSRSATAYLDGASSARWSPSVYEHWDRRLREVVDGPSRSQFSGCVAATQFSSYTV
jgi:hypothetical protein